MYAFVTGASSGIGRDIARTLSLYGYDLIITARREDKLLELAEMLGENTVVLPCDLSDKEQCLKLCRELDKYDIEICVNNAGFGLHGDFCETELDRELTMVDLNVKALHIFTKYFAKRFSRDDMGYILNVASIAGFMAGPLMATYYATKAYVVRLTMAVAEEVRVKTTGVRFGLLCPGPVDTEFNERADVSFPLDGMKSIDVARYAVDKMLTKLYKSTDHFNLTYMFPQPSFALAALGSKLSPSFISTRIAMAMQKKKNG